MKRIINFYILREILSLFLLGLAVFTLILLMGRLIKLTDMVLSRGVPLEDVAWMIAYLMPSFLVFTLPMAFLLAVLMAFGRLSADNEITVMKAGGISLVQLLPPVLASAAVVTLLGLVISIYGVPWGNSSFKRQSFKVLKQNVTATVREKVFWDEMPGIVLYTEQYDEERHTLKGVLIHDGREKGRPLTIFADAGVIEGGGTRGGIRIALTGGSIHKTGKQDEYQLINFSEYVMTIASPENSGGYGFTELDMDIAELEGRINDPATPKQVRLKMSAELQSRYSLPFTSLIFAVLAIPLGIQNRRSGKSAGFSTSIGLFLAYYVLLSLMRTMVEKGVLPAVIGLWIPNVLFLAAGMILLRMASQERELPIPSFASLRHFFRKGA
jgi:lipopolysaccharide export system permease protein